MDDTLLVSVARDAKRVEFLDEIAGRLEKATLFTRIRDLREALGQEDLRSSWTATQRRRLVATLASNKDVQRYMGYVILVAMILEICRLAPDDLQEAWRPVYDTLAVSYRSVAADIRGLYPDLSPLPATSDEDRSAPEAVP